MICNVAHLRINDVIEERLNKRADNSVQMGEAIRNARSGGLKKNQYAKITFQDGRKMEGQVIDIHKIHGIKTETMINRLRNGIIKFANGWKLEPIYSREDLT